MPREDDKPIPFADHPPPQPGPQGALLSALTTEHFVLQTANNATYAEASARSSLYVMALSSALVAIGFLADQPAVLGPFLAIVLPTLFVLGVFTVVRLVETSLESMHMLRGIAEIRAAYRGLGPDAARHFSAQRGRWPEVSSPAERFGSLLAFMGTTATLIAVINNALGGVGVALLVHVLRDGVPTWASAGAGLVAAMALNVVCYRFQRWRFSSDTY